MGKNLDMVVHTCHPSYGGKLKNRIMGHTSLDKKARRQDLSLKKPEQKGLETWLK
jgi:hypothetical protein